METIGIGLKMVLLEKLVMGRRHLSGLMLGVVLIVFKSFIQDCSLLQMKRKLKF